MTIRPQADGKTVVVSLEKELTNKKVYKLQVSKVKTLSGLTVEKVTKEFKAEDNQIPVVESVVVTGPKNLQITFSEPVTLTGTAKVALATSKSYSTGKVWKLQGEDRKVYVDTFAFKDGSTYKILVQGFQDFAKYKNIDAEIEFEYAKVTNAPTVEVVSATQEYVELKFDRPVKGLTLDHFYHTYSAWKPYSLYTSVEKMNEAIDKASGKLNQEKTLPVTDTAVVRFIGKVKDFKPSSNNEHPLPVGDVEFNIVGKVGSKKVEDNWKNQLQDTELKVTVTADKTAPVVESVEVTGETEVTITFSKKVELNKDNYEILKEDGSKVSGTTIKDVKSEGTTGVKLVLSNDKLVGKTIILNIKNVRDNTINQNKLVGTESFTITFGDKKFDGAKEASFYAGKDLAKIRIAFEEAVDSDSATNVKNYKLTRKGKLVDATFEASMINDKIVELIFTEEEWNKVAGKPSTPIKTTTFISDLKVVMSNEIIDVAGNKIAQFQKELPVLGSASAPTLKSAVANSTSEIKLTFSEPVDVEDGFGASNFKIKKGAAEYDVVVNDVTHDEKTITITLDTDKKLLPYDLKDSGTTLTVTYTGKTIQNVAGGSLTWVDKEIEDKIKPEAVKLPNVDKIADVPGTLYASAPFEIPGANDDEKQAFLDNLEKEKPAVALIWDGNKYVAKLYMTEAIDVNSLSNGTFELTAESGNYKWKPVDLRPTLEGSDKVIVIEYKLPKAKDFEKEIFTDLMFKQLTVLKDKAGNEFKLEEAAPVQFAPTKASNETAQKDAVNAIIAAKKDELTGRISGATAKLFAAKTADVLDPAKENFSTEYSTAQTAAINAVLSTKATLAEANEELKKIQDIEADIDAKVDMAVASTGLNVVFTKHNTDALKTVISGVGSDKYRIQVIDNKDKKYLVGAQAADIAATTVVELANGDFLFGTALTGATADSYVLVTKVDVSGNVLAQMMYQVKDIAK